MKRYATEYKRGKCTIKEFNWDYKRDVNRAYPFRHIDDAEREMDEMSSLMSYYEKQLVYQD